MPEIRHTKALVLTATPEGMIQDLGPFLSGRMMETDITPQSAIICAADENWRPIVRDDTIEIWFEGNVYNAENLRTFREKIGCAAGRMAYNAPTAAHGYARPQDVSVIARWDCERMIAVAITDPEAFMAWSGETPDMTLPHPVPNGTTDNAVLAPLLKAGSDMINYPPPVFLLRNGQILFDRKDGDGFVVYDPFSRECADRLRNIQLPPEKLRRAIGSYAAAQLHAPGNPPRAKGGGVSME